MASKKIPPRKNPCPPPPSRPLARRKASGVTVDEIGKGLPAECTSPQEETLPEQISSKSATCEMIKEQCFEVVPVKLTSVELARIDERVSYIIGEIEDKRGQRDSFNKTMGAEIKTLESQLSTLAKKSRDRSELREMECTRIRDYVLCEIRVVRNDTGEQISSRTMTGRERELELTAGGKTFSQLSNDIPSSHDDDNDDDDDDDEGKIDSEFED